MTKDALRERDAKKSERPTQTSILPSDLRSVLRADPELLVKLTPGDWTLVEAAHAQFQKDKNVKAHIKKLDAILGRATFHRIVQGIKEVGIDSFVKARSDPIMVLIEQMLWVLDYPEDMKLVVRGRLETQSFAQRHKFYSQMKATFESRKRKAPIFVPPKAAKQHKVQEENVTLYIEDVD